MILDVGIELLEELGYTVQSAMSGQEAIDIFKEVRDKIDLVIMDMIMPEMGGGETFDRLKEIDSDVKVLLSSGYSIDELSIDILNSGDNIFIQKPYNLQQMSQKLREILDKV